MKPCTACRRDGAALEEETPPYLPFCSTECQAEFHGIGDLGVGPFSIPSKRFEGHVVFGKSTKWAKTKAEKDFSAAVKKQSGMALEIGTILKAISKSKNFPTTTTLADDINTAVSNRGIVNQFPAVLKRSYMKWAKKDMRLEEGVPAAVPTGTFQAGKRLVLFAHAPLRYLPLVRLLDEALFELITKYASKHPADEYYTQAMRIMTIAVELDNVIAVAALKPQATTTTTTIATEKFEPKENRDWEKQAIGLVKYEGRGNFVVLASPDAYGSGNADRVEWARKMPERTCSGRETVISTYQAGLLFAPSATETTTTIHWVRIVPSMQILETAKRLGLAQFTVTVFDKAKGEILQQQTFPYDADLHEVIRGHLSLGRKGLCVKKQ